MSKLKNYHYEDPPECILKYTKTVHKSKKLHNLVTWYHITTFNSAKCNTTSQM
jgi:hypothetical protein